MGEHLFQTMIGVSTEIARARMHGLPTVFSSAKSRGAVQYNELASEVRYRMEG